MKITKKIKSFIVVENNVFHITADDSVRQPVQREKDYVPSGLRLSEEVICRIVTDGLRILIGTLFVWMTLKF